MRDLIKMVLVLTAICGVSALVLSYANKATRAQREYQLLKYVKGPSVLAVLKGYDNDPIKDAVVMEVGKNEKGDPVKKTIFPAKKGSKVIAVAYDAKVSEFMKLSGQGERVIPLRDFRLETVQAKWRDLELRSDRGDASRRPVGLESPR